MQTAAALPIMLLGILVMAVAVAAIGAAMRGRSGGAAQVAVRALLAGLGATALAGLAGLAGQAGVWLPLAIPLAGRADAVACGIRADGLGLAMTAFIAAIGLVVHAYADRYLRGDPRRPGFLGAITLVVVAAVLQALSPGLVQFALGWVAASIGLNRLLGHARERSGARRAALAKFVISRCGDAAMAAAILILLASVGTTDFAALAAAGPVPAAAVVAIVLAILLKTALVPAQSWLIGTVEAPTPVSALLHAGVVNAGGILAIRISPLLAATPGALDLLLALGLVSALVGPLVMWTQTDFKRSLAWSTVGQMGFMAVECGLGAYGAACLHLLGHGCYKANAFLRSGTLGRVVESRPAPLPVASALGWWALGLGVALLALAATYRIAGHDPGAMAGGWALVAIQAAAMSQLVATPTAGGPHPGARLLLLLPACALYAFLTQAAEHLLSGMVAAAPAIGSRSGLALGLATLAPLAVAGLGALWAVLPSIAGRQWALTLRVHAANGFYLPQLSERILRRLRPT